ncbi:hypothetical protein [Steroidobacter cummioxidans]|nr:hypothetical protein [Steroidobacter cummioxidans]
MAYRIGGNVKNVGTAAVVIIVATLGGIALAQSTVELKKST